MHMLASAILLSVALAAGTASAQTCSTLAVNGSGAPGTTLDFALTGGDANSFAFAIVGETTGTTSISFGRMTTLQLGLAQPFAVLPLGRTDSNGDVTQSFTVPPNLPSQQSLHAQGLTAGLMIAPPTVGLSFCTSNVVGFTIG